MNRTLLVKVLGLAFLAAVVIAGFVIAFAPLATSAYSVLEPYAGNETITVTESYVENEPLDYEAGEQVVNNLWWRATSYCSVKITNTGPVPGTFRVEFDGLTYGEKHKKKAVWQALAPGEQREVKVRYDTDHIRSLTYSVTPPEVEVRKYREVPVTREVTLYREVKYTRKVSVLERLRGSEGQVEPGPTSSPEPSPVSSPTPSPSPSPTSSPAPGPTPIYKLIGSTKVYTGLSFTITSVTWTGDELAVQWSIQNPGGTTFDAERLSAIFYPNTWARDQAGNEGEYFIPSPLLHDVKPGDFFRYETKWLFFPESKLITVHLSELWNEGSKAVDTSTEFSFSR